MYYNGATASLSIMYMYHYNGATASLSIMYMYYNGVTASLSTFKYYILFVIGNKDYTSNYNNRTDNQHVYTLSNNNYNSDKNNEVY